MSKATITFTIELEAERPGYIVDAVEDFKYSIRNHFNPERYCVTLTKVELQVRNLYS